MLQLKKKKISYATTKIKDLRCLRLNKYFKKKKKKKKKKRPWASGWHMDEGHHVL